MVSVFVMILLYTCTCTFQQTNKLSWNKVQQSLENNIMHSDIVKPGVISPDTWYKHVSALNTHHAIIPVKWCSCPSSHVHLIILKDWDCTRYLWVKTYMYTIFLMKILWIIHYKLHKCILFIHVVANFCENWSNAGWKKMQKEQIYCSVKSRVKCKITIYLYKLGINHRKTIKQNFKKMCMIFPELINLK